jgi:hypothetical protein
MSLSLLLPCFGYAAARLLADAPNTLERRLALAIVVLCAAPAIRDPLFLATLAYQMPESERPQAVFARLYEMVPPGSIVATTPRHWHCFVGRNRWRQTATLPWITPKQRLEWEWIVLPSGHGTPEYRAKLLAGFELVESRSPSFRPSGATFQPDEITWMYEVYRRIP